MVMPNKSTVGWVIPHQAACEKSPISNSGFDHRRTLRHLANANRQINESSLSGIGGVNPNLRNASHSRAGGNDGVSNTNKYNQGWCHSW